MLRWKVVFDATVGIITLFTLSSRHSIIISVVEAQPILLQDNHHHVLLNKSAWCKMNQATQQQEQQPDPSTMTDSSLIPGDDLTNGDDNNNKNNTLLTQLRQAVLRRCDTDYESANKTATSHQQPSRQQQVCHDLLQDTAQLQRILVARQNNFEKSADLVMEQVRFKIKWNPLHITPDMIPNALPSGAFRLCGYSKDGHVLVNFKLRNWKPNTYGVNIPSTAAVPSSQSEESSESEQQQHPEDHGLQDAVQEFVRYVVYMMELSLGCIKPPPMPDKLVVLFDLRGFSLSLVVSTRVRRMIARLIYVAQAQYPERLEQVYLLHAPFGFATAWQLLRPLLDERTAQKVKFADVGQLVQDIDPQYLSEDYGGNHAKYPLPTKILEEELETMTKDNVATTTSES